MAKKNVAVAFKMGLEQAKGLQEMCASVVKGFHNTGDLDELLNEFIVCFLADLTDKMRKNEKTVRIEFNSFEALAYYNFWNRTDTRSNPLATVVIGEHIKAIDKLMHQAKTLSYAKK